MRRRGIKSFVVIAFVIGLLLWIATRSRSQPQTTFTFLNYTNNGGQTEALFRLDHPPSRLNGDGLYQVRYHSSTGWARPTVPSIGWRWFGFDATGSTAAVEMETTNVPAQVVMSLWVGRSGVLGFYDDCLNRLRKLIGQGRISHDSPVYVTNETVVSTSNP